MNTSAFCDIIMVTRDVFKVLKLHSPAACAILRTLKTSLMPIYQEMHLPSYDFLFIVSSDRYYKYCQSFLVYSLI